jgi:hypothetical protein
VKRLVVLDENGQIVATAPHPDDLPGAEDEGKFGVLPVDDDHVVYEVELPGHMTTLEDILRLHESYTVAIEEGRAKLVERAG